MVEQGNHNPLVGGSNPSAATINFSLALSLFQCIPASPMIDSDTLIHKATQATFGHPVVSNVFRAVLAEALVASCLHDGWVWCSGDWAPYDFKHNDGTRLEVKQSAARQSWHTTNDLPSKAVFDIASRKGFYEGKTWHNSQGRNADIYVFAYHPITDDTVDHRDPKQWLFFVVATSTLPNTKKISLAALTRLTTPINQADLGNAVEKLRNASLLKK